MYGQEAFNYLAKHSGEFESVLDVGSGSGDGTRAFEGIGKLAEFFPCKAFQGFDGRMLTETNMEPNK